MKINEEAAEIFEKEFKDNGGCPKRWKWVCLRYINFYFGNGKDKMDMAEDIVLEAVEQTITGVRKWDREKDTMDKHIYNTVWSKVNHLYEKRKRLTDDEIYDAKTEKKINIIEEATESSKSEIELQIDNKDLIEKCYNEIKDDTDMGLVFELLLEGKTPKEIEKEYGITTEEVDAIKKRINRLLKKKFKEEYYS